MSPHQIPHTEIVESFVEREIVGGTLQDLLTGGIRVMAVSSPRPLAGGSPRDVGIGVAADPRRRSTVIRPRDMRVVALEVTSIGLGGVLGHWL